MKKSILLFSLAFLSLQSCCNTPKTCENCPQDKSQMNVVLNIVKHINPENVSAFRNAFDACRRGTLNEKGCISYEMYQSYTDSCTFFLAETWKNKDAHILHMTFDHFKAFKDATKGMDAPQKGSFIEIYVCPDVNNK